MSRAVDPSELLMELGFGGPEKSYIARIPVRFFGESTVSVYIVLKYMQELVPILI